MVKRSPEISAPTKAVGTQGGGEVTTPKKCMELNTQTQISEHKKTWGSINEISCLSLISWL